MLRQWPWRETGAALLVPLVAAALLIVASCSGGGTRHPAQVALFGDSLSFEAQPYYTNLIHSSGETALTFDSHGGTAICDWLPRMREVEEQDHPRAVELQFSGNALTPCMSGKAPPSAAYYEQYRADTEAAIAIFAPGGGHVYLIGAPISRSQQSDPTWDMLNRQYAEIAAADARRVTYVDAGTAVEGDGHTYVDTLPCLAGEPCTGPVVGGVPSNTVRAPDGAHFCPVKSGDQNGVVPSCPVYASGAFRYANAMVEALVGSG